MLTSLIIGGAIPLVINIPIQVASYVIGPNEKDIEDYESISDYLIWLVPPKTTALELIVCLVLTYGHGFLMSFALHKETQEYFDVSFAQLIVAYILTGLSSVSLFCH